MPFDCLAEHNEDNYETVDHECDVDAYCTSCKQLLPWPLYQIRGELDGAKLSDAPAVIAELMDELEENGQTTAA